MMCVCYVHMQCTLHVEYKSQRLALQLNRSSPSQCREGAGRMRRSMGRIDLPTPELNVSKRQSTQSYTLVWSQQIQFPHACAFTQHPHCMKQALATKSPWHLDARQAALKQFIRAQHMVITVANGVPPVTRLNRHKQREATPPEHRLHV